MKALLNKFYRGIKFSDDEVTAAYAYLFLAAEPPHWVERKPKTGRNLNKTLLYLKELIVRNELYSITEIEAYYEKKRMIIITGLE